MDEARLESSQSGNPIEWFVSLTQPDCPAKARRRVVDSGPELVAPPAMVMENEKLK